MQVDAGPLMVGMGMGLTDTGIVVAASDVQPFELVKLTFTVCVPAVFHFTVMLLLVTVPPAVIMPPGDTVHI